MFFKKRLVQKSLKNDLTKMFDDCIKTALKNSPIEGMEGYLISGSIHDSKEVALDNALQMHLEYNLEVSEVLQIIDRVHKKTLSVYLK